MAADGANRAAVPPREDEGKSLTRAATGSAWAGGSFVASPGSGTDATASERVDWDAWPQVRDFCGRGPTIYRALPQDLVKVLASCTNANDRAYEERGMAVSGDFFA